MGGLRRPESILLLVYTDDLEVLLLKRRRAVRRSGSRSRVHSIRAKCPGTRPRVNCSTEETGIDAADALIDIGQARTFTIDPALARPLSRGCDPKTVEHEWRLCLPCADPVVIDPGEHSARSDGARLTIAIDAVWSWTNKEALEALSS